MIPRRLKHVLPGRARDLLDGAEARVQDAVADRVLGLVTRRIPLPFSVAGRRVLLLGASVGRAWRPHLVYPNLRTMALYQFDKTPLVERALALRPRPDAVVIKECAAYFPPDRTDALGLVAGWIRRLREEGVVPALATVAPVTLVHARQVPGRAEGIWRFNDLLRELAQAEGVALLDLEQALRSSADQRYLPEALHSGDGLHLRRSTYRQRLDPLIAPFLLRVFEND